MPLSGLLVAEIGDRIGVSACGSLLAQLGADVVLAEARQISSDQKWRNRALAAAGKRSITLDSADAVQLERLLESADVILLSSDITPQAARSWHSSQIICDITAFGNSGPWSGLPYSDAQVQAISGLVDTTGDPSSMPTHIGLPILEYSAGLYAAAAIITALRVRRLHGYGQRIDIALFDCAIGTLSTFLPFHAVGKPAKRAGNRHSLAAPWNAYRAADGWVLICTGTDDQWQRLCTVMQQPELASAPGMATNTDRVARHAEVDACVERWSTTLPVLACVEKLSAVDIPCGPIATVEQLSREPNLLHRGMVHELTDPLSARKLFLPGSPLKAVDTPGRAPTRIPKPDEDRVLIQSLCKAAMAKRIALAPNAAEAVRPLAGVRVLEIGQYTTAPLVSRQLAAFGAEVLKIEPPGGDGSRTWPPGQGDQGYFFTFSNSDKQSLMVDLRSAAGKADFKEMLKTADVLVENLKPGSLARLGFGPADLQAINSRLVYCGISGFGADSAYPQRPAFDTVVQAMSGFMDLTRCAGAPTKAGISAADIVGGACSLLTIVAALEYRDKTGHGQAIDISMQDCATWVTQMAWNGAANDTALTVQCTDGYVLIEAHAAAKNGADPDYTDIRAQARNLNRDDFVAWARRNGVTAAPVASVSEAVSCEQSTTRQLIVYGNDASGQKWPLLNSPMRLEITPPQVRGSIGKLGEANGRLAEIFPALSRPA